MMVDGNEIVPGCIGYGQLANAPPGGGLSAWYADNAGHAPGSLDSFGLSTPYSAMTITTVPEPSTIGLCALGLGLAALLKRRGRRSI